MFNRRKAAAFAGAASLAVSASVVASNGSPATGAATPAPSFSALQGARDILGASDKAGLTQAAERTGLPYDTITASKNVSTSVGDFTLVRSPAGVCATQADGGIWCTPLSTAQAGGVIVTRYAKPEAGQDMTQGVGSYLGLAPDGYDEVRGVQKDGNTVSATVSNNVYAIKGNLDRIELRSSTAKAAALSVPVTR